MIRVMLTKRRLVAVSVSRLILLLFIKRMMSRLISKSSLTQYYRAFLDSLQQAKITSNTKNAEGIIQP